MERAIWCNFPACFQVGLLRLTGRIFVLEFNYFTFPAWISSLYWWSPVIWCLYSVPWLKTWLAGSAPSRCSLTRKYKFLPYYLALSFRENKNPRLVLLNSLTFCSAEKALFSECLLVLEILCCIPYWLSKSTS